MAALAPWLVAAVGTIFLPVVLYGIAELRVSWRAKLALFLPYPLAVTALALTVR